MLLLLGGGLEAGDVEVIFKFGRHPQVALPSPSHRNRGGGVGGGEWDLTQEGWTAPDEC